MLKVEQKRLTYLSLILLFVIALLPLKNLCINNEETKPTCDIASDGWYSIVFADALLKGHGIFQNPPHLYPSEEKLYHRQPPVLHILGALSSKIFNTATFNSVYNGSIVLLFLIIFITWLFIRKYDAILAYFSIPLFTWMFFYQFSSILRHGQFYDILGFFFLALSLLILGSFIDKKEVNNIKIFLWSFIFFLLLIYTHIEYIYLFIIMVSYLAIKYFQSKNHGVIKRLNAVGIAFLIAVVISISYLTRIVQFNNIQWNLGLATKVFGSDTPSLISFHIFSFLILTGIVYWIIEAKKKYNFLFHSFLCLLLISNIYLIGFTRAYEIMFFYPIIFAPMTGLVLKGIYLNVKKKYKKFMILLVPILIILIFIINPSSIKGKTYDNNDKLWEEINKIRDDQEIENIFIEIDSGSINFWDKSLWYSDKNVFLNMSEEGNLTPIYEVGYKKIGFLKYERADNT